MFGKPSQHPEELNVLLGYLKEAPRKVVLEIGVHLGNSLNVWSNELDPDLLIGIEPDELDIKIKNLKLIKGKSQDTEVIQEVNELLGRKKVDFLFIDGDHTYEQARLDFDIYGPLVKKGGIIAIHDVSIVGDQWKGLVETNKLWEEVKGEFNHTLIYRDGGMGVGVIFI